MSAKKTFPVKNQYRGINAHLHSLWQATGTWNRFHNAYIATLMMALQELLLPMGYVAEIEDSIQMRRVDESSRRIQSDISIYDVDPARYSRATAVSPTQLSGMVVPLPLVLEDNPLSEKPYSAVIIHPRDDDRTLLVWIELASPSNKRPGEDNDTYLRKRTDLLTGGVVFVELDYLHETPPTLAKIPDYSRQLSASAHPYRILVLDPRPEVDEGLASINEFDVDVSIPSVVIPLSDTDTLGFNFDASYQYLFERAAYGFKLDYSRFPMNFDRYSPADQARIARRMLAVLKAKQAGTDLETAPLPVEEHLTLAEATAQIHALNA